jgi:radical SAM superfamily enzyme YgiQ (UPF0313 family)
VANVKILLLSIYNNNMTQNIEDVGICCIASFMREKGYQVKLLRVKENLVDYDKILEYAPGIIGASVYSLARDSVYRTAARLKQLLPGVFICAGGPLPAYAGKEMLEECPAIDFIVRGEGELTFWELASLLPGLDGEKLKLIKGLTYREKDKIRVNENRPLIGNINDLPMPARDILRDNKLKTAQVLTSRGCFSRCTFCISDLYWKKWRGIEVEAVVNEIEYIVNNYGIRAFNFCDASFEDPGGNLQRITDIARGIISLQVNISYFANLRAEFHRKAADELMRLLKESGLCGVCVGIESANEQDLKLYGKIAGLDDNIKFIQLFRPYEINVDPGFINFNPYSDFDGLHKNIDFLEKYDYASNFDYIRSRFKMFKGTKLYLKLKEDGLLETPGSSEDEYRFLNKKVEYLYNYIEEYLKKIDDENYGAATRLAYYTCSFFNLLFHLKRQFKQVGENEGYKEITGFEGTHRAMLVPVNRQVAAWFRALLVLAENGWDQEKAHDISRECLSIQYLSETMGAFEKKKIALYRKLIKMNLDNYIVDVK